jgi:hypothetical protein
MVVVVKAFTLNPTNRRAVVMGGVCISLVKNVHVFLTMKLNLN